MRLNAKQSSKELRWLVGVLSQNECLLYKIDVLMCENPGVQRRPADGYADAGSYLSLACVQLTSLKL